MCRALCESVCWLAVSTGSFCEERQEALYPAVDGASADHDAPFGEQLLRDVGVAEPVAHVPSDGESDDLIGEAVA